jgi:ABC-type phosphate transport system substrate-binding protein
MGRRTVKAVLVVTLVLALLALVACTAGVSTAEQQKQKCFANQTLITTAMHLFIADSGVVPPIQTVVEKLNASCPASGTYSYDEKTGVVSCSVHGHP